MKETSTSQEESRKKFPHAKAAWDHLVEAMPLPYIVRKNIEAMALLEETHRLGFIDALAQGGTGNSSWKTVEAKIQTKAEIDPKLMRALHNIYIMGHLGGNAFKLSQLRTS